jgi:hypothetical protein
MNGFSLACQLEPTHDLSDEMVIDVDVGASHTPIVHTVGNESVNRTVCTAIADLFSADRATWL